MSDRLQVVCTDRGAHKPRTLARLSVGIHKGRVRIDSMGRTHRHTDDGRFVKPPASPPASRVTRRDDGGVTFTFTCPVCRRNVPLRDDRLAVLAGVTPADAARIASEPELGWVVRWDVSSLDISHAVT